MLLNWKMPFLIYNVNLKITNSEMDWNYIVFGNLIEHGGTVLHHRNLQGYKNVLGIIVSHLDTIPFSFSHVFML